MEYLRLLFRHQLFAWQQRQHLDSQSSLQKSNAHEKVECSPLELQTQICLTLLEWGGRLMFPDNRRSLRYMVLEWFNDDDQEM